MSGPFRETRDRLGEAERDTAAIQDFGRWHARIRTRMVLLFALAGIVPAGAGYWFAMELQFRYLDGAFLIINVAGAAIPWLAMIATGTWLGRAMVRKQTPAKLAQLAKDYEVPVEQLAATTDLVANL